MSLSRCSPFLLVWRLEHDEKHFDFKLWTISKLWSFLNDEFYLDMDSIAIGNDYKKDGMYRGNINNQIRKRDKTHM